jgi:hypothetical protein
MVDDAVSPPQPPLSGTPPAEAVTPPSAQVLNLADAAKAKTAKLTPVALLDANASDAGAGGDVKPLKNQ